jgi:hypothetical protein
MKLTLALSVFLAGPCLATIANVQHVNATNAHCSSGTGTSCSITVASTGAGNAGAVCIRVGTSGDAPSAGGWTIPSGWPTGRIYCLYNLNLTGGLTSLTFTVSSGDARDIGYYEWSSSVGAGWIFDTGTSSADSNQTNPPTQALTLNHPDGHDVIFQMYFVNPVATGIASPYVDFTADVGGAASMALADALNTSSGSSVAWTQSSSVSAGVAAIALHETQASGFPQILQLFDPHRNSYLARLLRPWAPQPARLVEQASACNRASAQVRTEAEPSVAG